MTAETRKQLISVLRNKAAIMSGCAQIIAEDSGNSVGSRAKARTIVRVSEDLIAEIEGLLGAERTARPNPSAHLGEVGE